VSQPSADGRPPTRVDDVHRARLLLDRRVSRFMVPFMGQENSVSAAADELGVTIAFLLPRVRRLVREELLIITREELRKGRPIKYYRAAADEFFIPMSSLELSDALLSDQYYNDVLVRNLVQQFEQFSALIPDAGFSVYRKGNGIQVYMAIKPGADLPLTDPIAPPVMWEWRFLRLPHERAKQLQLELLEVLQRARDDHDPTASPVFVNVRMTPLGRRADIAGLE
jgi:hypothetical protein